MGCFKSLSTSASLEDEEDDDAPCPKIRCGNIKASVGFDVDLYHCLPTNCLPKASF